MGGSLVRRGLLLLVAALLLTAGTCAALPRAWAAEAQYAQHSTVRLSSHGGSATVIWTGPGKSYLLSAAHMFKGADRAKPVRFEAPVPAASSGQRQHFGTRVLDVDPAADLALFEWLYGPAPYVAPVAPAGAAHPRQLLSVGFDELKLPPQVRPARLVSTDARRTLTDSRPWHGRSGGALLDPTTGYLWGVVSGYTGPSNHREVQSGAHGIYASHAAILAFLGRNGWSIPGGAASPLQIPSQPPAQPYPQRQGLPQGC